MNTQMMYAWNDDSNESQIDNDCDDCGRPFRHCDCEEVKVDEVFDDDFAEIEEEEVEIEEEEYEECPCGAIVCGCPRKPIERKKEPEMIKPTTRIQTCVSVPGIVTRMNPWKEVPKPPAYKIGDPDVVEKPKAIPPPPVVLRSGGKTLVDQALEGFQVVKKKEKKEKVPTATKPCKFQDCWKNKKGECTYGHNASDIVVCRWNEKCLKITCTYYHTYESFEAFRKRILG